MVIPMGIESIIENIALYNPLVTVRHLDDQIILSVPTSESSKFTVHLEPSNSVKGMYDVRTACSPPLSVPRSQFQRLLSYCNRFNMRERDIKLVVLENDDRPSVFADHSVFFNDEELFGSIFVACAIFADKVMDDVKDIEKGRTVRNIELLVTVPQ